MEKLQDIELTIKDIEKDGVFAISLVENPAIEENWVHLSSHQIELKVVDEEKRIVVGYALIPDKKIYRKVQDKEFNIFFSADTVRQTAELYMKQLNLNNVTTEHENKIEGASVIESWITEDEKFDKVNMYGLKPILGGWAVMMKIYNDNEWEAVKRGDYKGFSIEGRYDGFEQLQSKQINNIEMDKVEQVKKIIAEGLKLESQNVELALIDDVSKLLTRGVNIGIKTYNNQTKAESIFRSELKSSSEAIDVLKDALYRYGKLEQTAKELGLNPSNEMIKLRDGIEKELKSAEYIDSRLKNIVKALS